MTQPTAQNVQLRISGAHGRRTLRVNRDNTGKPLTELLRGSGLPLNTRCGQRGTCDGCTIELRAGSLLHLASGQVISAGLDAAGVALRACAHALGDGPASIHIPARSALAHEPQALTRFCINVPWAHDPLWPDAPERDPLGIAVDVGTTTVAVLLIDLRDGTILADAAAFNAQMRYGDDVLTRIQLCMDDRSAVARLQQALCTQTLRPLVAEALRRAGRDARKVRGLVACGNTTMLHLLAGVDPSSMGVAPFTPVFLDPRVINLDQVMPDNRPIPCHLLGGSAAYIGADLAAGTLASGLLYDPGPSLLVDVGTNGEIILAHAGRLEGCATAAGPAFEGAGLSSGIRAGDGAISHVHFHTDPFSITSQTISQSAGADSAGNLSPGHECSDGDRRDDHPLGLCGSAYVDVLADARRIGLLNRAGRFDLSACPGAASHVIPWHGHDRALRLAHAPPHRDIVISQRDIAALLQAKAAIAAGILTLLDRNRLRPADIQRLYLAGGFGTYMDARSAIACGLLPGFAPRQVQTVGNAALAGAYLALVDRSCRDLITRAAGSIQIVELNLDAGFEARYIDQLVLPDGTDPA